MFGDSSMAETSSGSRGEGLRRVLRNVDKVSPRHAALKDKRPKRTKAPQWRAVAAAVQSAGPNATVDPSGDTRADVLDMLYKGSYFDGMSHDSARAAKSRFMDEALRKMGISPEAWRKRPGVLALVDADVDIATIEYLEYRLQGVGRRLLFALFLLVACAGAIVVASESRAESHLSAVWVAVASVGAVIAAIGAYRAPAAHVNFMMMWWILCLLGVGAFVAGLAMILRDGMDDTLPEGLVVLVMGLAGVACLDALWRHLAWSSHRFT